MAALPVKSVLSVSVKVDPFLSKPKLLLLLIVYVPPPGRFNVIGDIVGSGINPKYSMLLPLGPLQLIAPTISTLEPEVSIKRTVPGISFPCAVKNPVEEGWIKYALVTPRVGNVLIASAELLLVPRVPINPLLKETLTSICAMAKVDIEIPINNRDTDFRKFFF
jgi:hypothetical protein